jgi:acyl-CoA synthetase (AMP-forming)/AMP-acid ligase II
LHTATRASGTSSIERRCVLCDKSLLGFWSLADLTFSTIQDLIKVRGWQVAPAELEAILLTHPQIINVAVIGIPVPEGTGEVPRAFVVRKPKLANGAAATYGVVEEKEVSEEEIKEYLLSKLSRYKALDGGVQFVDTIPRNATGKALKTKLREMHMGNGMK